MDGRSAFVYPGAFCLQQCRRACARNYVITKDRYVCMFVFIHIGVCVPYGYERYTSNASCGVCENVYVASWYFVEGGR